MDDKTLLPILEILKEYPAIQYVVGVFISIVAGVWLMNLLKSLFPDKKKDDPSVVIVNTDDDALDMAKQVVSLQHRILRGQRRDLEVIVNRIKKEKSLDDTIPFRDELLAELDQIIKEIDNEDAL